MPLSATSPLVCILNDGDARPTTHELEGMALFAVRHPGKKPTFSLIKSRQGPTYRPFNLNHFTERIDLPTLASYIRANLS